MAKGEYARELSVVRRSHVDAMLGELSNRSNLGVRNRALILLLARTGIRLGECLAIRIANIDFGERTIYIPETKSRRPHTVGVDATTLAALQRWIDRRRLILRIDDRVALFCSCQGRPISGSGVRELLKRLARRADIEERLTPHSFRRGFVTTTAARLPLGVVSQALNHASPLTTLIYLKRTGLGNEAVAAMREFDWGENLVPVGPQNQ